MSLVIIHFIWKGKDKVKRSALTSEVENGGQSAPHLESLIKTQQNISVARNLRIHNRAAGRLFLGII